MHVWYHPTTFQVMALSSHGSTSKVWENTGYKLIVNDDPDIEIQLKRLNRDCKLVIRDGVITGCAESENPEQPGPTDEEALEKPQNG
jgi:hypothetical protein